MDEVGKSNNKIDRFRKNDAGEEYLEAEKALVEPGRDIAGEWGVKRWSEADWKTFKRLLVVSAILLPVLYFTLGPKPTPQEMAERKAEHARNTKFLEEHRKDQEREARVRQKQAEDELMNPALAEARRRASQPIDIGIARGSGNTAVICATQGDEKSCRTIVQGGSDGKAYVR